MEELRGMSRWHVLKMRRSI